MKLDEDADQRRRDRMDRDLSRQIRRKLWRWIDDSLALYEMGDLPDSYAAAAIFTALINSLADGVVSMQVPTQPLLNALEGMIAAKQRDSEEKDADTATDE